MVEFRCPHCQMEIDEVGKNTNCPSCDTLLPELSGQVPRQGWFQRRKARKAEKLRENETPSDDEEQRYKGPTVHPAPPSPSDPQQVYPPRYGQEFPVGAQGSHGPSELPGHGLGPAPPHPPPPEPIEDPERALDDQVLCPNCSIINKLESTEELETVDCQYCNTGIEL